MSNYSSTTEVKAFTRHLLDGQTAFNSTTRPTGTELSRFLDRISGVLDLALLKSGFAVPVTNTTAKLALDDWATMRGAAYVELTQRGSGHNSGENSRESMFINLDRQADQFVAGLRLGLVRAGVTVSHGKAEGLAFTGQAAVADRADPDDNSLAQPLFRRNMGDDPAGSGLLDEDDNQDWD